MKKFVAAGMFASAIALFLPSEAIAQQSGLSEYGTANLGGSAYLTWAFPTRRGDAVGYACLVRDAIGGMANSAYIHRYAIAPVPGDVYYDLQPLNAVEISPSGQRFAARTTEVIPTETIWSTAPLDESQEWFEASAEVDVVGRACVDGGVAGAIERLEQRHEIQISR